MRRALAAIVTVMLISSPGHAQMAGVPADALQLQNDDASDEATHLAAATRAHGGTPSNEVPSKLGPPLTSAWEFGGELNVQVQSELTRSATTPAGEPSARLQPQTAQPSRRAVQSNSFVDANLENFVNYANWLSFNSDIQMERTRWTDLDSYYAGTSNFFNNEAVSLRELYVTLRPFDGVAFYGGKFHPDFGSAYDQIPGIFYNFAGDYEQIERIGFGALYQFPDQPWLRNAHISVETFYLDTSFLSNTLLSRPALDDILADRTYRFSRGQFGPANTGALNSYTVAFHGGEQHHGLSYQISYTGQATSDPMGRTSHGASVGAGYDAIPLGRHFELVPFMELTWVDNFNNVPGLTRHYVLGSLALSRGPWELDIVGGIRVSSGFAREFSHQENLSLNYALTARLSVAAGIQYLMLNGRDSWTVGPSLTYTLEM